MRYILAFLVLAFTSHAHAAVFELHPLLRSRIEESGVFDLVWDWDSDESRMVPTTTPGLLAYGWTGSQGGDISWKSWTGGGLYRTVSIVDFFMMDANADFYTDGEMLYIKKQPVGSTSVLSRSQPRASVVFNFWDNLLDGNNGITGYDFRVSMSGLETVQWGQPGEDAIAFGVAVTPFVVPEPSWAAFVLPLAGLAFYRLRLR